MKFCSIEMCARSYEVLGTIFACIEREQYLEDTGVEVIEEHPTDEVLIQFWELAHTIIRGVPETHERSEQWYGIGLHHTSNGSSRMAYVCAGEGAAS